MVTINTIGVSKEIDGESDAVSVFPDPDFTFAAV